MVTTGTSTLRGAKSSVLQVTELLSRHRFATLVLGVGTGADSLTTALTFLGLPHYNFLLSTFGRFFSRFLCFFKLGLEIRNVFLALRHVVFRLRELVLHRVDLLVHIGELNLESRELICLGLSLGQLALECLCNEHSLILLFLHLEHLLSLLLFSFLQIRVFVFERTHIAQFGLDLLGDHSPGTFGLVVDTVEVIVINLVGAILGLDSIRELLELEVIIQSDYIALNCLKHAAPRFLARINLFFVGTIPQDLDALVLLI